MTEAKYVVRAPIGWQPQYLLQNDNGGYDWTPDRSKALVFLALDDAKAEAKMIHRLFNHDATAEELPHQKDDQP